MSFKESLRSDPNYLEKSMVGLDLITRYMHAKYQDDNTMFGSWEREKSIGLRGKESRGVRNGYPLLLFGCFKKLSRGEENKYLFPLFGCCRGSRVE